MFTRLVALFALLASVSAHTWTYESTSATCDGTDANPCGPVSMLKSYNLKFIFNLIFNRLIGIKFLLLVTAKTNLQLIFLKPPQIVILDYLFLLPLMVDVV